MGRISGNTFILFGVIVNSTLEKKTWFYKIGRISANTGPILKIQNLAYSGERGRSGQCEKNRRARRDARDDVMRARDVIKP